jgi:serine/threonine protein kinase
MRSSTTTQTRPDAPPHGAGVPQPIADDRSMPLGASRPKDAPPPAPVQSPSAVERRRPPSMEHELTIGDRVGRFVIDGRLGEGGMGVVWRALDPEVGRRIALKFVRASTGGVDARLWSRLRREAQALARVRHPNVVGLYDVGNTPHGSFLAMEHLDGTHLRRWLERGARTWQEKVEVLCQAGLGLLAVHRAGLVHRDVKPTNLLVCRDGRVVLLDFGLALGIADVDTGKNDEVVEGDDVTLRTRMTRRNMVVGTTSYMSPEQLLGRDLDARSDQFSFCVTLFESLFGQRPYAGKTPYELALQFESRERPKIADRGDVPRHVCGAVLRGLRIDPAERFASMVDLLDALRPHRGWAGRWMLAAAGVGLGLLGATAGAIWAVQDGAAATETPAIEAVRPAARPDSTAPAR